MQRIGERLSERRKALDLSQAELSSRLGIGSRQTLSKIENGQQAITAEQLAAAASELGVESEYFTDPFHAAGEAAFSFRAGEMTDEVRKSLEEKAGRWLATMRELSDWRDEAEGYFVKEGGLLRLTRQARYEHAQAAARTFGRRLELGNVPARRLEEKLAGELGIEVLYVDLPEGVSGAATRMTGVQAILVNRSESPGRRMFNLAHELFHLLTWDTLPPPEIDRATMGSSKRVEELANSFSSALLMPREHLSEKWQRMNGLPTASAIAALADYFQVSAPAVKWRLVNLDLVDKNDAPSDVQLLEARVADPGGPTPQMFNLRFVDLVHSAVEAGRLSFRKALSILGMTSLEFADLCRSYGRTLSYEV